MADIILANLVPGFVNCYIFGGGLIATGKFFDDSSSQFIIALMCIFAKFSFYFIFNIEFDRSFSID